MTKRLQLNWKLDGFIDEQRYYCSEMIFNADTKPAVKAVLSADDRSYIDTDIEPDKTYFVAVGSVQNNVEKLSEVKKIIAKNFGLYSAYFTLENTLIDQKDGISLTAVGGATVSTVGAYFAGNGQWMQRPDSTATTFLTGNLTVECEFKCERIGTYSYDQVLVDNFIIGQGGWQLGIKTDGRAFLYLNNPNVSAIVSPSSYSDGDWHKIRWTRIGNINTLYVDGVSVGTYTDQRNFTQKSFVAIGAQVNSRNSSYDFKGWIKNVGYAKQAI